MKKNTSGEFTGGSCFYNPILCYYAIESVARITLAATCWLNS
jgi:hypothetical protein